MQREHYVDEKKKKKKTVTGWNEYTACLKKKM